MRANLCPESGWSVLKTVGNSHMWRAGSTLVLAHERPTPKLGVVLKSSRKVPGLLPLLLEWLRRHRLLTGLVLGALIFPMALSPHSRQAAYFFRQFRRRQRKTGGVSTGT
jgi:hypothetical protein